MSGATETARVVAALEPFSLRNRVERTVEAGQTVAQLLGELEANRDGVAYNVSIAGTPIPGEKWGERTIEAGELVTVRGMPTGGGDVGSKESLRIVAQLATFALAAWVPGAIGLAAGTFGAGLASTGILAGGSYLASLIGSQDNFDEGEQAAVNTTNRMNPYGVISQVCGTHRLYPDLATRPWYDGKTKSTVALYLVSLGPVELPSAEFRYGDRSLDTIDGIEYEIREGKSDDEPRTLFPPLNAEERVAAELEDNAWSDAVATKTECDEIAVEARFNDGLYAVRPWGSGEMFTVSVGFEFMVSLAGQQSYHTAVPIGDPVVYGRSGRAVVATWRIKLTGESWGNPEPAEYDVIVKRGDPTAHFGTGDPVEVVFHDASEWASLTSYHRADPVQMDGLATVGVRIPDDVEDGLEFHFNLVASSILPVWDGNQWEEYSAATSTTSNPAAIYRDIFLGPANARPLLPARMDDAILGEFYERCVELNCFFNAIFNRQRTVYQASQAVASIGRARFAIPDGKFGVVMDRAAEDDVPKQTFTPRNSWGFSATKTFQEEIHGIKVQFVNADANWEHDEAFAYTPEYESHPEDAELFESVELWGCTNADQAGKYGRYLLEVMRLRPEAFALETDIEHLVCTPGDPVDVSSDVAMIGIGSGARVLVVYENESEECTGIKVDELFDIPRDTLGVRIRMSDNTRVSRECLAYNDNTHTTLMWEEQPIQGESQPGVDDLIQFGILDLEAAMMMVIGIEPHEDMSATLALVNHAPGVHTPGVWEPHQSYITVPMDPVRQPPGVPFIVAVQSDETVLERGLDGSLVSRIVLTLQHPTGNDPGNHGAPVHYPRPETVVLQYRMTSEDNVLPWESVIFAGSALSIWATDVTDGLTYDLRVRAISKHNVASAWTPTHEHMVIGKTSPPPDVTDIFVDAANNVVRWVYENQPLDHAGFQVRYQLGSSTSWDLATHAHEDLIKGTEMSLSAFPFGDVLVMVKAVDTSGNPSENPATVEYSIPGVDIDFLLSSVDHFDENWASYDGALPRSWIIAGVIDPGTGYLVGEMLNTALFWPANPDQLFWGADPDALFWPQGSDDQYGDVVYRVQPNIGTHGYYINHPTHSRFALTTDSPSQDIQMIYRRAATASETMPFPGRVTIFGGGVFMIGMQVDITLTGGPVQPVLQNIQEYTDMVWREETLSDVSVAAAGDPTTLQIQNQYSVIVSVTGAFEDGSNATAIHVVSLDRTGPEIYGVDGDGVRQSGTLSAVRVLGW